MSLADFAVSSHSIDVFMRGLGCEGIHFDLDKDRCPQLRYALAYSLTHDGLCFGFDPADVMGSSYIPKIFDNLKSNEERKLGDYFIGRVVLDACNDLVAKDMRPNLEGSR